ncbi:hypothetical protein Hanom_Chr12g01068311 [Helianthus anomalus]
MAAQSAMEHYWAFSKNRCSGSGGHYVKGCVIEFRVNYKFCPLCLHQIACAVLLAKSLQAVPLIFQNFARFVL